MATWSVLSVSPPTPVETWHAAASAVSRVARSGGEVDRVCSLKSCLDFPRSEFRVSRLNRLGVCLAERNKLVRNPQFVALPQANDPHGTHARHSHPGIGTPRRRVSVAEG